MACPKSFRLFSFYILYIIEMSRPVQHYMFEHTLHSEQSSMYRDCFRMPKAYGNYKERYTVDADNYIHYCIRNEKSQKSKLLRQCGVHGKKRTFSSLYEQSYEEDWLIENDIPSDLVDAYGEYLILRKSNLNDSKLNRMHKNFICICPPRKSIGRYCEYFLPYEDDVEFIGYLSLLDWYINFTSYKFNREKCLDWRDICDGKWDCSNGEDERQCIQLEMNSCQSGIEFRCRNGLCIPRAFLFDGDFDCMDGSDERHEFNDKRCYELAQFDCDERICPYNTFSCGDGQCVDWEDGIVYGNLEYFVGSVEEMPGCRNQKNLR
ncbi:unnamed protein product, partial [Adineta ricciae]